MILGHSLVLLIHFLCAAQFARALCCACFLARLLTRSRVHGEDIFVYELNPSYSYSSPYNAMGDLSVRLNVCLLGLLLVMLTACRF